MATQKILERDIEAYFVRRVRDIGGKAFKFVSPTNRGVSDRLVVLPGNRVWFVEVKQMGGRLTPLQRIFAEDVKALGCNYAIIWSKGDADAFVTAHTS